MTTKTLTLPIKTISRKQLLDCLKVLGYTNIKTMLKDSPEYVLSEIMDVSSEDIQYMEEIGTYRYAVLDALHGELKIYDASDAVKNKIKRR